jgi:assimilatory nitrate reductase catalytic subunit
LETEAVADGALGPPVVKTTCPYCGVGCGVSGMAGGARGLAVSGDISHPANAGRLCSKGSALGATVGLEGRLLSPMIGDREASWSEATALVARRFAQTIARHGPDSVAFYVSGQLLTEDYYAANKLMKGFIGSGNIDTNSRLCMASAVAAHKLAFGADLVPGCYEDLDLADLVVFSGHNAAWTHPVLFRRMEAARARGQRHVVIDPRRTDTAEVADLHLPLAPQMDVRLWNGLLADLMRRGAVDRPFIAQHVNGFAEIEAVLAEADQSAAAVAADCGLALADLQTFFDLFAATPRTVSLFSMGANQSAQGTAKGLAILNAHLATGRIGKPGACPFSITGQPNAMGGRETGGMANTLAGHMDFTPAERDRVARFWGAPSLATKPGLKAVDMFRAIGDGRIKAVWIMATNPAVSMPDATRVREALAGCPFVVVSDCMAQTDTMAFAHVKLPALAWGEKDGTVTNSERCISRQRALFPPPGQARPDWKIIADVAEAMGHADGFTWPSQHSVFREWARLTAFENHGEGARVLDLSGLVGVTLCGDAPRRRRRRGPRRRRPGPHPDHPRRGGRHRPAYRSPAPGRPLPAHALDRRLRTPWPLQPPDRLQYRSDLGPAGVQAQPGPRSRLSRDLEGLPAQPRAPRRACGTGPHLAPHPPDRRPPARVCRPRRRDRARRLAPAAGRG